MGAAWAWAVSRFGVFGTVLLTALLGGLVFLAGQNAWLKASGWWKGRQLERATAELDVARQDVRTGEAAADVADRATAALGSRLGEHQAASAATIGEIDYAIQRAPARPAEPDDPDILRAVDAARGRAEAAAAEVQRAGSPEPGPAAAR